LLLEPDVHADERGFLVETYRTAELRDLGIGFEWVQENHSRSRGGVLRGIHLQPGQAKLVRCSRGRIWDVAVDLRPGSPTFRRWEGHELDDERHRQLLIPPGFGHGFCTLSEEADVSYFLSSVHNPDGELGVAWDDPELAITWPVSDPVLSERDRGAPKLAAITAALQNA
jgi:dTDP-4-dehydrorhamnose 3,5-epimerase